MKIKPVKNAATFHVRKRKIRINLLYTSEQFRKAQHDTSIYIDGEDFSILYKRNPRLDSLIAKWQIEEDIKFLRQIEQMAK